MAVSRFILNQSQLNDANAGLDGFSPAFVLNTSTLDSIAKLDGFTFTTTVIASAGLGGLSSSASALVSHRVTAGTVLGGVVCAASASVSNVVSAQAVLGGIVGVASATVAHTVSANAALGAGVGLATASVLNVVSAQALLGGLYASATANVFAVVTASASLGGLVASANATVDPAPTPPPAQYPGGNPWYRRPQVVQQPKVEEVVQVVIDLPRLPRRVSASGSSSSFMTSVAVGVVTWSILEDEAELLLLV
jgi:hypothetical protein